MPTAKLPGRNRLAMSLLIGFILLFPKQLVSAFSNSPLNQPAALSDIVLMLICVVVTALLYYTSFKTSQASSNMARVWACFAIAKTMAFIGYLISIASRPSGTPPSPAEAFYLLEYPLTILAVLLLPARKQSVQEILKDTIDITIILLVAVLIYWNFILGPMVHNLARQPFFTSLVYLGVPISDLLLLGALLVAIIRLVNYPGYRPLLFLVCGIAALIFADGLYTYSTIQNSFPLTNGGIDAAYGLSYFLTGLAAVFQLQNIRATGKPTSQAPFNDFSQKFVTYLSFVWVLVVFAMLAHRIYYVLPMSLLDLVIAAACVTALVILRQMINLNENDRLSHSLETALQQVRTQAIELETTNHEMKAEIVERLKVEQRLTHDALHDALTGLPNRSLFLDHLEHANNHLKREPDYHYAVLFLDLDSFKLVNDSLGHVMGDQLLVKIARLLSNLIRSTDTVARLGGDEFVILLENFHQSVDIENTAKRLLEELNQPIDLDGQRIFITASIGIVKNLESYEYPEDILRDADLAMYQAKSRGKARYEIFDIRARTRVIERQAIENDLRHSIEAEEFILNYQPILELPRNRLVGFEALVRWNHPRRGIVAPTEFIPIAEETGMIIPLGRWILREACREAALWQTIYPVEPALKVNVNISAVQFKQPDFILNVAQTLTETCLPGSNLVLEVTESACLENIEKVAILILSLKGMNVEVQIDDFGTGYSSLSYLHRLPVSKIKIDRSFIQSIDSEHTPDLVSAIMTLVDTMGITAVAEGIENEPQITALRRLRCAYVQGYWFARPMIAEAAHRWMRDHEHEYLKFDE